MPPCGRDDFRDHDPTIETCYLGTVEMPDGTGDVVGVAFYKEYALCPRCDAELLVVPVAVVSETEVEIGRFLCPDCGWTLEGTLCAS